MRKKKKEEPAQEVDRQPYRKNAFDPKKWPKTENYFINRTYRPQEDEDGKTVFVPNGFSNGDYPSYERDSYCQKRIGMELGLKPQDNMIAVTGDHGNIWMPIFRSDEENNIRILFYTLDRELIYLNPTWEESQTHRHSDNDKERKPYMRIRLHPDNCREGQKYQSPTKKECANIYPFIPPQIIEKWERGETFDTLVITEGEIKAMKGCMCGGHVIGICGIQMFYNTGTHEVFQDIVRIVRDCQVKNLVFLHDGDCMNIAKSALESRDASGQPDEELTTRPRNFMKSATTFFRMYRKVLPKVNIYWQHINSKTLPGEPKGLDNLLTAMPDDQERIIEEMEKVDGMTVYFHRVNLTTERQNLAEHFALNSLKDFYSRHKEEIDPEPKPGEPRSFRMFLFDGTIYRWNDQKNVCEEILSRDMMAYKRIGTSWFKEAKKPTAGKDKEGQFIMTDVLLPWSRQNITDDYGSDVLKKLHKYDGFVNLPSHDDYRRVIRNFYNLYRPLAYKPSEEDLRVHGFPYIYSTLEHIFGKDNRGRGLKPGDAGYDENSQFDIGVDYIQLLYQKPMQNLPILCLVSNERGTGKTSLLDLLYTMFDENAVIVGNDNVQSNFNSILAGRLVVGVDESSLADNKGFTEKLKMWSTSTKQTIENKGKDPYQIDNFTKYILCSNNETRFIYASNEEVRFWVRKVPPFPEGQKVGKVKIFYEEEVPAFMAWLNQREMWYAPDDPRKIDRMYFPPEILHTKWLDDLLDAQRPRAERKMREWLKQWFIDFGRKELITTPDKLQEAISYTDKKFGNYDLDDLKRYIEENMHVKRLGGGSGKSSRFKYQIVSNFVPEDDLYGDTVIKITISGNGRPYIFYAKDYLSQEEYWDIFPDERPQPKQGEIQLEDLYENEDEDNED